MYDVSYSDPPPSRVATSPFRATAADLGPPFSARAGRPCARWAARPSRPRARCIPGELCLGQSFSNWSFRILLIRHHTHTRCRWETAKGEEHKLKHTYSSGR